MPWSLKILLNLKEKSYGFFDDYLILAPTLPPYNSKPAQITTNKKEKMG